MNSTGILQGTAQQAAGLGVVFGDGVRCAAGTTVRLGTRTNSGGASSHGGPSGDIPVSIRGNLPVGGGTREYPCWYRNADAFCTASTFSSTNGVEIAWAPSSRSAGVRPIRATEGRMRTPRSGLGQRLVPTLVGLLFVGACDRGASVTPLANAGRAGLACTEIEEVFALDVGEIDLGTAFLLADRELDPAVDVVAGTRRLDELAREFLAQCEPDESTEDTLRHLVETASSAPRSGEAIAYEYTQSLLSRVIEQGQGSCVSLSALYLAVAERSGLELSGVVLPNHFKVRHEGADGVHEIETTNRRISRGRDDRVLRFFSERDRTSSRFGETLSARDTLANYVAEIGHRLHDAGSSARGLELCRLAIAAWPDLESAHLFVGNIESELDAHSGRGIAAYERALEIRPDDAYVWLKLGHAHLRAGSCALALAPCSRAVELDPDLAPAWLRLAQVHLCQRRPEDALAACRAARAVRLDRIHPQDVIAITAMRGTYRGFEAEVYRTESAICVELARGLSGATPIGMERAEALLQTERWLALSDLCKALACPELFPLETGRWAHRSAIDRVSSNAQLAADPELIDLAAQASAHLETVDTP